MKIDEVLEALEEYLNSQNIANLKKLESELSQYFDTILFCRKEELVTGFSDNDIGLAKNQFIYLVKREIKEVGKDTHKEIQERLKEAIKRIAYTIDSVKANEVVEKYKKNYQDKLEYLSISITHYDHDDSFESPDIILEQKEQKKEIEKQRIKIAEIAEGKAWEELEKIRIYIMANKQKLIWGYMLNHPESELWRLIGDLGVRRFERMFIRKIIKGGDIFKFPNEKDLQTEGKQYIARFLKDNFPEFKYEQIVDIINRHYDGEVDERQVKYWLTEKESNVPTSGIEILDVEKGVETNTKIWNAINARVYDEKLQQYLESQKIERIQKMPKRKTRKG